MNITNFTKIVSIFKQSSYVSISVFAAVFALIVLNIIQINITSTKGYDIRALEEQKLVLQKEHKDIKLSVSELKSMTRVSNEISENKFVQADIIRYINTDIPTVALDN